MNELEFRRRVQLNPHDLDPECQAYLDAATPQLHGELERFRQRCVVEQHDELRDIRAALNVAVPEGLAERALLRTAHGRKKTWFGWLPSARNLQIPAAFASIAVAVTGAWMLLSPTASVAAQIAINHIEGEPAHAHLAGRGYQSPERVQNVLNRIGLRLEGSIAQVEFAANCDVEGKLGAHFLLERDGQPVTVLVYPQKDRSDGDLEHDGEIVAMPYGSLVVFAENATARRNVLNTFKQHLSPSQVAILSPY